MQRFINVSSEGANEHLRVPHLKFRVARVVRLADAIFRKACAVVSQTLDGNRKTELNNSGRSSGKDWSADGG